MNRPDTATVTAVKSENGSISPTAALAAYVTEDAVTVPAHVRRYAKMLIADQLACQLAGAKLDLPTRIREAMTPISGPGASTVVGSGTTLAPDAAAYLNSVSGHANEFDDTHLATPTHPGAVVIPAALAVAEHLGSSGQELLDAVIVGYEVMLRVSYSVTPGLIGRGHHPAPAVGPFGAAAAAARLYSRRGPLNVGAALAIASSHAAGLLEYTQSGGSVKRLHCAIPSQAGVRSAILADAGVTGPLLPLEGNRGFCQVFSDTPRTEELSRALGDEFLLLESSIKTYCCCAMIHPALHAFTQLRDELHIRPDDIASIELYTPSQSILQHIGTIKHPRDVVSAQFSLGFSLAMLLSGWRCSWTDYESVPLADPDLNALSAKVSLALSGPDAGFETGFRGIVRLTDGHTLTLRADHAPGEPDLPIGHTGVRAKVQELTTPVIGESQTEELLETIDSLESIPTVRLLTESFLSPAVAAEY